MNKITIYGLKYFPSRGGTSRVVENLVLQLKDKYDITLYCYKHPDAATHIEGVKVIQMKPLFAGAPGSLFYFLFSAIHLLFKGNADIVHAHSTDCSFFLPLLKLRYKIIATSHEAPYTSSKWNWFVKLYFRLVERIFIRFADIPTCISAPLTEYYTSRYNKEVHFIPNGINPYNRNIDYTAECKAFLPPGASLEKPFVFYSGRRHISTKGCHTLLEALTRVGYEGQVFFAGEMNPSKYIDQLKEYQSKLNLFFIDFIHPLPVLLSFVEKCDLFIFPSEKEAMSIMLLEVASVGRPIIASDIPPNKHVFNDDEVLFFRSKDVEDLAEKIRFALDNKAAMSELGRKALKKVNEQYLWQMVSKKYEVLYESMLKGNEAYA